MSSDLDQSPTPPFDLIARGPTFGFVKDYSGTGGLTDAELTTHINQFTATLKGVVPGSGGGTVNFLRADGTWIAPGGGGGGSGFTTPQNFGAFADNTLHAITQADINANLATWWGLYDLGTSWDTVALQEAIYACFGNLTTSARPPANAVKVIASVDTLFGDPGLLVDGSTGVHAVSIASRNGFDGTTIVGKFIRFFFRAGPTVVTEATLYSANTVSNGTWQWQGSNSYDGPWTNIGSTFTLGGAATQVQTSLNGNATPYQYYQLLGISGAAGVGNNLFEIQFKQSGSYVTGLRSAINQWFIPKRLRLFLPAGSYYINRGLLLVAAEFSIECEGRADSQLMWYGDSQTCLLTTDSVSYCNFTNLAFDAETSCDTFWMMNGTGTYGGLKTQQITVYDLVMFGNGQTNNGCQISSAGNAAQGDTITFVNPYVAGCLVEGMSTNGQNALSIKIVGGDFQACPGASIAMIPGFFLIDGTSFQNQAQGLQACPPVNQILLDSADVVIRGGQGPTNIGTIKDVRSESDVFMNADGVTTTIENSGVACAGFNDAYRDYPFLIGHLVHPSTNNTKSRQFIVVGDSGDVESYPNGWNNLNPGTSTTTVIVDNSGKTYTVNQWQGVGPNAFVLHYRYGSNGFTKHDVIVSNTATAITLTSAGFADSNNAATLYHIGGKTDPSVTPNFDAAPEGNLIHTGGVGQGFSTTAGSNILTGSSSAGPLSPGDYVVIPHAKFIGVPGSYRGETAYIAKVLSPAGSTGGPWTMDKIAGASVTFGTGYFGTPIQDNKIFYLHIPFAVARKAISIHNSYFDKGYLEGCGDIFNATLGNGALGLGKYFYANPINNAPQSVNVRQGGLYRGVYPLDTAQSGTINLASWFANADNFVFVPNGNITFNAPAPVPFPNVTQRKTFHFTTQGTTSFAITFGTNFISNGPIITGTVADVSLNIVFESSQIPTSAGLGGDNTWREVSRYPINGVATTVSLLPAAGIKNRRRFVTDASAVTFQSIVAGAGANNVPVFDDGTNWRIG